MNELLPHPPLLALRQPRNIGSLLIKTKSKPPVNQNMNTAQFKNHPCENKKCKTCPFMTHTNKIQSNTFSTPLKHEIDCSTKNVIYLISCKICSKKYVGQTTTTLRARFNNHRYSVLKPKEGRITPVGQHFNSAGHHGVADIILQGLEVVDPPTKESLNERESFWLWNLGSHNSLSGLNVEEPFFNNLSLST